ncbi:phage tail spike protein [Clostridium akagii]|uniref:phage tail spike protein n=1 Tax=Clostridium akagii TaxID=91623 RepID=UPI00047CD0F7|nr:phage tail spike protein [Clostridium akagii]
MLIFYDKNHNKIAGLTNYREYNVEREFNSEDTLSFQYPSNDVYQDLIQEECYIRTRENEYIVKEVNYNDDDWVDYVCKINIENIKGQNVDHFEIKTESCFDAVNLALAGTGWTVGSCDVSKIRPVSKSTCTAYDVLQEIQSSYDCEMSYDSINKKVYVYNEMGEDKGAYFAEQLNLKKLEVQGNSYDYVTKLVPIGKDGLDITTVNNGINYIENHQYSNKSLIGYWEDNRYTDPTALMEDAIIQLNYQSKPLKSYKVDLVDLAKAIDSENYAVYNLIDYSLGDTVTILSREKNIKEKQRIAKMTIYPEEPERNEIELSNKSPSLEYLQIKFQDTSDVVDAVTTSDGTIDGSKVDNIDWDNIQHVHIEIADVDSLNATIANIGKLNATEGDLTILNAVNGNINSLVANKATIDDLSVTNAKIKNLISDTGDIDTLLAGNITSENMATGAIQAGDATIANGAIASAQIIDLDVAKLNAGNISTNKFVVTSDSGNLKIQGNVMKVWDTTGKERVSLGLNGTDYNLLVRGSDGNTVLFGTDGVTHEGITQGAVDDSKIDVNANINGSKLNIDSVFGSMNGSTSTLSTSKVKFDDTGQTLQVAFTNLSNTVIGTSQTVSSQGTSISVIQGNITNKIWQTDINTAINNVQIGGRNLINNAIFSGTQTTDPYGGNNARYMNISVGLWRINNWTVHDIDTYSLGFWAKSTTAGNLEVDICDNTNHIFSVTTTWQFFKIEGEYEYASYLSSSSYGGFIDFNGNSLGTLYLAFVKLEKGSKCTDWTSAPEDTQSQITTINSNYSTVTQTLNSLTSSIGSLNSKTDTTNGNVTSVNSQVNTLSQTLNGLSSTVGSVQTSVSQKATPSDIATAVNNIQVGGVNYLTQASMKNIQQIGGNSIATYNGGIAMDGTQTALSIASGTNPQRMRFNSVLPSINGNYNISFWAKTTGAVNVNGAVAFTDLGTHGILITPNWTKISITINVTNLPYDTNFFEITVTTPSVTALFDKIMIESGNKASDWVPAVADSNAQIYNISFNNLIGCAISNNTITKTSNTSAWDAGCGSPEPISNGKYIEETISTTSSYHMIGLSHTNPDANYINIQYAWYTSSSSNDLQVYESGTNKGTFGTWAVGDVLRISMENNNILYYKNGVLLYTSATIPTLLPLYLDTSLYTYNSTINNINIGTMLSGIATRISTAESSIIQLNSSINLDVTTTTYNAGIAGASTDATNKANTAVISAKTYTDSQISITEGHIALHVAKDSIIASINLSSEGIAIKANKIDLTGYATFNSLSSPGSTTINGNNITTGKISASVIDTTNLTAQKISTPGSSVYGIIGSWASGAYTATGLKLCNTSNVDLFRVASGNIGDDGNPATHIDVNGALSITSNIGTTNGASITLFDQLDVQTQRVNNLDALMILDSTSFAVQFADHSNGTNKYWNYSLVKNTIDTAGANYYLLSSRNITDFIYDGGSNLGVHVHNGTNTNTYWIYNMAGSDVRLKYDIKDTSINALDIINRIKLHQYTWKDGTGHVDMGVIAQELEEINPLFQKIWYTDECGVDYYAPDYNNLMPYLIGSLQEQNDKITSLENEITELKNRASTV